MSIKNYFLPSSHPFFKASQLPDGLRRISNRMGTPTTCHHPPFTFSFSSGVRVLIIAVIMKYLLSYTIAVTCQRYSLRWCKDTLNFVTMQKYFRENAFRAKNLHGRNFFLVNHETARYFLPLIVFFCHNLDWYVKIKFL